VRRSLLGYGERHRLGLSGEDLVVSVNQLNCHLVLAGRQPGYVDCVVVTRGEYRFRSRWKKLSKMTDKTRGSVTQHDP
jgi:hypothetical protein